MSQGLELKKVILPGVCAALLLSGCGGSGNNSTTIRSANTPPADASSGRDDYSGNEVQDYFVGEDATLKAGVFLGELTYTDDRVVNGFMLLSPTGNFTFILETPANSSLNANIVSGTLALDGTEIEGFAVEYELLETWNRTPDSPDRATFPGSVPPESNDSALLDSGGRIVKTEITRDNVASDRSLSFDQIGGGTGLYEATGPDAQITIDTSGVLTGSNRGCMLDGQITIPTADLNIFELSYKASGCTDVPEATGAERDGEYLGVGTFIPEADHEGEGNIVEFGASNGKIADYFTGTR